jgi:DNA-binding response OmpR family regulator
VAATILIVDDEREIRELLRYNLERQGYQVLTAQDGEEGLSRIFATHPDLVLLDLLLPGLNGLEVLRELRQEPSTRDLPVLLLTARGAEMDKLLGFERGADDYITKPFSPREVIARVEAVLRRIKPPREVRGARGRAGHARPRPPRGARATARSSRSLPREFELLYFLAKNPAACSRATSSSPRSGATTTAARPARSTCHVRRLRASSARRAPA